MDRGGTGYRRRLIVHPTTLERKVAYVLGNHLWDAGNRVNTMSRRVKQNQSIPSRGLATEEAARYVGCHTVEQFEREVRAGIWPPPFQPCSRPKRWDRAALDHKLDQMSGLSRKGQVLSENPIDHASFASNAFEERARSFNLGNAND